MLQSGLRSWGYQGCLAIFTMATLVGCGESKPVTYKVTGQVSFSGKAIPEGVITFEDSSTGVADSFPINGEGKYEAKMPAGKYGVSILPVNVEVADTADSEGGAELKKVDYIPNRYRSSYESKLVVDVNKDTQFDVQMKPGGTR